MKTPAHWLLTPLQMQNVDKAAAASGLSSYGLMRSAGLAVAAQALKSCPEAQRFVVLCGPGNNGGDGYVAAAGLEQTGAQTQVFHIGDPARLTGDAALARACWAGRSQDLTLYRPAPGDVVIDALFGAGLDRLLKPDVATVIAAVQAAGLPVIAADLPSGVHGRTGQVMGAAFAATHTVTFMCRKPGHVLLPGRSLCGEIHVVDIGIPHRLVMAEGGSLHINHPDLWRVRLPSASVASHKFTRGHLAVFSGPALATGAARLAAMAGLKAGAGLVTIASPPDAIAANAAHLTAVMLKSIASPADLAEWLTDPRISAFVLGPGFGIGAQACDYVKALSARNLVLDADGISSFKDDPQALFDAFSEGNTRLVLTPHEGEFHRLFADIAADTALSKVEKALAAAKRSHAVVLYKGSDTVIASPDGRAAINVNAPPSLATAGSGDVLAGIIGGLLAQNMPAFEAACAGAWFHGEAGHRAGPGLTAEDLVESVQTFVDGRAT